MELRKTFFLVSVMVAVLLGGCSTGAYFWQATAGHLKVLTAAQDIDEVIAKTDTPNRLRTQLKHVKNIRAFSENELKLPDNSSYKSYADLKRNFVVWNVVASDKEKLQLKTWCFPFAGCISYKGFYAEADARELAELLRAEGLDVATLGVPAYSTLGFTPDPVLNTFINYPAGELARLIFHELAHQVVYIEDDTMFNESFATAVEEIGVEAWLAQPGYDQVKADYAIFDSRRVKFRLLLTQAKEDLEIVYSNPESLPVTKLLELKQARFEQLAADYSLLKAEWGGWSGYDRFMSEDLNNAKLGMFGLYTQHVSAFKALFKHCDGNFERFYKTTAVLGKHKPEQREKLLSELVLGQALSFGFTCL